MDLQIEFTPGIHQHQTIEATKKHPFVWMCGGLGSGKSHLGVHWVNMMVTQWAPGCDGLIVQPDYATFEDVFMALWRQEIPGEGYVWRLKTTKSSGRHLQVNTSQGMSTIFVRSAMNIQNVVRIDGLTTISWCLMDEPARMLCGQMAFEKVLGRLRNEHPKRPRTPTQSRWRVCPRQIQPHSCAIDCRQRIFRSR